MSTYVVYPVCGEPSSQCRGISSGDQKERWVGSRVHYGVFSTGEWQPNVTSAQQLKPKLQHGLGSGAVYSQESAGLAQGSGFDPQKLMFVCF